MKASQRHSRGLDVRHTGNRDGASWLDRSPNANRRLLDRAGRRCKSSRSGNRPARRRRGQACRCQSHRCVRCCGHLSVALRTGAWLIRLRLNAGLTRRKKNKNDRCDYCRARSDCWLLLWFNAAQIKIYPSANLSRPTPEHKEKVDRAAALSVRAAISAALP
jgi:hypothetical protein